MERLVLFAKAPRLHQVKTRLLPRLTAEQALGLHGAMLEDQLALTRSLSGPTRTCEVCLDVEFEPSRAWAPAWAGLPRSLQGEGDLGARLHRALSRALDDGALRAIILGADAPTLPGSRVEEAFAKLRAGADAVIVPALDGGYVLVGASRPVPRLFEGIPWGTPSVSSATRERAREARYALAETAPWGDVDTAADLIRLAGEVEASPGRAPATASFLAACGLCSPQNPVL